MGVLDASNGGKVGLCVWGKKHVQRAFVAWQQMSKGWLTSDSHQLSQIEARFVKGRFWSKLHFKSPPHHFTGGRVQVRPTSNSRPCNRD